MSDEPTKPDRKEATTSPPAVWATMANEVREYDQDNVKRGKGDVDTLLVFAGLFSAVLASFLVAVYPSLQPSPMDVMNYTLQCIANQTASYNFTDGRMVATNPSSPPPPFQASAEDIRVNVLWFASLIISLITSSFGMLVKQWMDDVLAVDIPEPQARLRLRHHRAPQIEAWLVYEIVACLPLLLHLSLGLFFVGLCYFTAAIHASIGYTTLPLVIGWTFCLFSTTALPIFFPRCPYKISLFKPMIARFHRTLSNLLSPRQKRRHRSWHSYLPYIAKAIHLVGKMWNHLKHQWWVIRHLGWRWFLKNLLVPVMQALLNIPDEDKIAKDSAADLKIFSEVDAMRANDEILGTIIAEELPWIRPSATDAISFALEILAHRVPTVAKSECLLPEWPFRDPFPLALVRAQVKDKLYKILDNHAVLDRTSYNGGTIPIFLRQQDKFPDKTQRTILCALTMIISDIANSPEVKLPPSIVDFLRLHIDNASGPAVCRDILSLMVWHSADTDSGGITVVRLVTALGPLAALLDLSWEARNNCFKSILCLNISRLCHRLKPRYHVTWDHLYNNPRAWKDWNIPDDAPNTLKAAFIEYLFILLSAEFKRVEDSKESSPEASAVHQETPEVLCCALRHLMKYNARHLTSSGFQAFVDLLSTKSEELMGIMVESLVSTDLFDAQNSASKYYGLYPRWPNGAYDAVRLVFRIKPSSTTLDESFATLLFVVGKKLGLPTADHPTPDPDIDLHQCLSLCHIAIFLYVTIHAQPDKPELGQELFSSIADALKRKMEGCGAEIFDDKVARQLAFDCLLLMRFEQEYGRWDYDEWLAAFSQSRKTSFPDTLVEVLGRFIPDDQPQADWLWRLRELKERPHSVQSPVDAPPDQQASELEVQSTEQDENPAVAVVDKPDSTTPTYPSITQDLPLAGSSTGVKGGFKGKGGSEGEGKPEGAVNERDSTMKEDEPEASQSSGKGEEGSLDDEIS